MTVGVSVVAVVVTVGVSVVAGISLNDRKIVTKIPVATR